MAYTRIQIDEMFEKLPDTIQEAMGSDTMIAFLKKTEKKYSLTLEQTQELSAEIGMLMMGASAPQNFIPNIKKSMGVSEEIAKDITTEVNEEIFQPIKDDLKSLYSSHKKEVPKKINILPIEKTPEQKTISVDPYREVI